MSQNEITNLAAEKGKFAFENWQRNELKRLTHMYKRTAFVMLTKDTAYESQFSDDS